MCCYTDFYCLQNDFLLILLHVGCFFNCTPTVWLCVENKTDKMEDIKNKLENYKEELRRQKAARLKKGDTTKGKHIRKLEAKVKLYEGFLNAE